jgi:uncharacterized protein (DUF924 family)
VDHARALLDFWFGPKPHAAAAVRQRMAFWFGGDSPEMTEMRDRDLEARYATLMQRALAGELAAWADSPRRRLALILLLDQLPRNIHRGTDLAFASDARARAAARRALDNGWDIAAPEPERQFFYMPFEHSEDAADQALAVQLLTDRLPSHPDLGLHARAHHEVIRRFGRFPTRNAALGRTSSPEEEAYLAEGGYGAVVSALKG